MRHELIEALSGALFALALLALEKLLPFPEPYNILAACIVGAIGFAFIFAVAWRFRHSRLLRNLDDLHHFLGSWLEIWHDSTQSRYSISTIRFEGRTREYILAGDSYDQNGTWKAQWTSHNLYYDRANSRLVYVSGGQQMGGRMVFGATCLHINDPKVQGGRGFFVDDSSGVLSRIDFQFERILDKDTGWKTDPTDWVVQQHALRNRARVSTAHIS
jgi:hypothetical protein